MLMLKAAVLITEKVGTTQMSIKQLEKKNHNEMKYHLAIIRNQLYVMTQRAFVSQ